MSTDQHFTNFIRMFLASQLTKRDCTHVLDQLPEYEDSDEESHIVVHSIASQIAEEKEQEFEDILYRLQLSEENLKLTYDTIVREIFRDGINWGRILAFLVFSSALAVFCAQNQMESRVGDVVAWTETEMHTRLREWMIEKGGWKAFMEHFDDGSMTIPHLLLGASVVTAAIVGAAILMKKFF